MEEARGVGRFGRYLIELQPEGAYLFVFESSDDKSTVRDCLQDSVEIAKEQAQDEFGVPLDSWHPFEGKGFFG